jgi:hypothetical protein
VDDGAHERAALTTYSKVLFAAVLLLFLIYPVVMWELAIALRSKRLRVAELGRELLVSPFVKQRDKEIVHYMLDRTFDWKFSILTAVCFPLGFGAGWFRSDLRPMSYGYGVAAGMFGEFIRCYMISMLAANPIFGGISCVEVVAFLLPGKLRRGKGRLSVSAQIYSLFVQAFEFRKRFGCTHCRRA